MPELAQIEKARQLLEPFVLLIMPFVVVALLWNTWNDYLEGRVGIAATIFFSVFFIVGLSE